MMSANVHDAARRHGADPAEPRSQMRDAAARAQLAPDARHNQRLIRTRRRCRPRREMARDRRPEKPAGQ
jgi:hypothetical protein